MVLGVGSRIEVLSEIDTDEYTLRSIAASCGNLYPRKAAAV